MAATISVNPAAQHQSIDGFGASSKYAASDIHALPEPQRTQVLDLLFAPDTGIGLTIVRNAVWPSFHPSASSYDWSVVNDEVWLWNEAKKRGAQIFYSVPWSPPGWMKDNSNPNNGGSLLPQYYQAYADEFSTYVRGMKTNYGIDVYAMSVQNEPDMSTSYNSCIWSGDQIQNFVANYLAPTFARDNVSAKVMITEQTHWGEDMALSSLNDSNTASKVDIVAAHYYGSSPVALTTAKSKNKRIWQTEASNLNTDDPSIDDGINWAWDIHDLMTQADANAWLFWWLAINGDSSGQMLIHINGSSYSVPKRFYTLGNYSKFVWPGYVRIDATANPESGVYTSAYKDPSSGKIVIVAINTNGNDKSESFTISGISTGTMTPYVTSSSKNLEQGANLNITNNSFSTTLPAGSVSTFVLATTSSTPTPTFILSPTPTPVGDINGDGKIDGGDLFIVLKNYLTNNIITDLNKDGLVNMVDGGILIGNIGNNP